MYDEKNGAIKETQSLEAETEHLRKSKNCSNYIRK